MKAVFLMAAGLLLSGCGRYANFTLPQLAGGDPNLTFRLEAQPLPVLTRGEGWESHDVLNPSVTRWHGLLFNLYSGFDGQTWRTGLATSSDGIAWERRQLVLSPDPNTWEGHYIAANGAAFIHNSELWYWFVAGPEERPRIGVAHWR
ncbi:MAG TPA: hypothetical protein VGH38_22640, partial [Bryobacteraceae bacterium]